MGLHRCHVHQCQKENKALLFALHFFDHSRYFGPEALQNVVGISATSASSAPRCDREHTHPLDAFYGANRLPPWSQGLIAYSYRLIRVGRSYDNGC